MAVQSIGFPSSFASKHGSGLVHAVGQLSAGSQVSFFSTAPLPHVGEQSGSTFALAPAGQQPSAAPDAVAMQLLAAAFAAPDPPCAAGMLVVPAADMIAPDTSRFAIAAAPNPAPPAAAAFEPAALMPLALVPGFPEPPPIPAVVIGCASPEPPPPSPAVVLSSGEHQPERLRKPGSQCRSHPVTTPAASRRTVTSCARSARARDRYLKSRRRDCCIDPPPPGPNCRERARNRVIGAFVGRDNTRLRERPEIARRAMHNGCPERSVERPVPNSSDNGEVRHKLWTPPDVEPKAAP